MDRSKNAATRWLNAKLQPHLVGWIPASVFVVVLVLLLGTEWVGAETYGQLRSGLFTGFFTVAGFLLTAKNLIIINMRKEVYDNNDYLDIIHQEHWEHTEYTKKEQRLPRGEAVGAANHHLPLIQMGDLLTVNIALALVTSFAQLSLGLMPYNWAAAVCLSLAASAGLLLLISVYFLWQNMQYLYTSWEKVATKKLDERWEKALNEYEKSKVKSQPGDLPILKSTFNETPKPN